MIFFFISGLPALNDIFRGLDKSWLRERKQILLEEVDPLYICDLLLEESAIDIPYHDMITETNRRREQISILLKKVEEDANNCFLFFLYILQTEGYHFLTFTESDFIPQHKSIEAGMTSFNFHACVIISRIL